MCKNGWLYDQSFETLQFGCTVLSCRQLLVCDVLVSSSSSKLGAAMCKYFVFAFMLDGYIIQKWVIGRAKRAPHWGVQSRFRVIYTYMSVGMSVVGQNA